LGHELGGSTNCGWFWTRVSFGGNSRIS
jgi:hypothetical protein